MRITSHASDTAFVRAAVLLLRRSTARVQSVRHERGRAAAAVGAREYTDCGRRRVGHLRRIHSIGQTRRAGGAHRGAQLGTAAAVNGSCVVIEARVYSNVWSDIYDYKNNSIYKG